MSDQKVPAVWTANPADLPKDSVQPDWKYQPPPPPEKPINRRGNPLWVKGMTPPNPGGRRRKDHKLHQLCKEHTYDAVATLYEIMKDEGARRTDRIMAANSLLDRGWGRPAQAITTDSDNIIPIQFVMNMGLDKDA